MKVNVSKFENSSYRDCSLPLTVGELKELFNKFDIPDHMPMYFEGHLIRGFELVPNYDKKTLEEDDDLESYNDSSNWRIEFS